MDVLPEVDVYSKESRPRVSHQCVKMILGVQEPPRASSRDIVVICSPPKGQAATPAVPPEDSEGAVAAMEVVEDAEAMERNAPQVWMETCMSRWYPSTLPWKATICTVMGSAGTHSSHAMAWPTT